jgi:hypothetical protein
VKEWMPYPHLLNACCFCLAGADASLTKALGQSNYRFVHAQYLNSTSTSTTHEQVRAFLRVTLGVQQLNAIVAMEAVIRLHHSKDKLLSSHTDAEIVQHAHFLWQQHFSLANIKDKAKVTQLQESARKHFLLLVHPATLQQGGRGDASYMHAAEVYHSWPHTNWELTQVLLPGEVCQSL